MSVCVMCNKCGDAHVGTELPSGWLVYDGDKHACERCQAPREHVAPKAYVAAILEHAQSVDVFALARELGADKWDE